MSIERNLETHMGDRQHGKKSANLITGKKTELFSKGEGWELLDNA